MDNFILTQSAVKDFEKESTCPARWKAQWVDRLISFQETDHMKKGNYFEWLILGANAKDKEPPTPLLLKNGKKSADTLRIESQADRVYSLLFQQSHPDWLGFDSIQSQLFLKDPDKKRGGTIDIFAVAKDPWIVDLKLTGDLTSRRTPYSWGNDWGSMDNLQLLHYKNLFHKNYGVVPRTGLLVVDYSPKMRIEFGEMTFSEDAHSDYEERFSYVEGGIKLYNEENKWPRIPGKDCSICPLECTKRLKNENC
jgi:hypothetical protein